MPQQKPLPEQFRFDVNTPLLKLLPSLLLALEARFQALEGLDAEVENSLSGLESLALARLNETFTPLIVAAQERLENFGATFAAHTETSLSVGPIGATKVITIDEADREGFIYSDYSALRADDDLEVTMLCAVQHYDRESGQLQLTVATAAGAGTHVGWQVRISAAPDLAHASRTDNPHSTTAAQVGAYTIAETDDQIDMVVDAAVDTINTGIAGFGFMRQSLNLNDLVDKNAARVNLNAAFALGGYTALNKAGDTCTGNFGVTGVLTVQSELRTSSGILRLSNDLTRYLFWSGSSYSLGGAGDIWHTGNFNPATKANTNANLSGFNNDIGYATQSYVNGRPVSQFSNDAGYVQTVSGVFSGSVDSGGNFYFFGHNGGIYIEWNGSLGSLNTPNNFRVGGNFTVVGAKAFRIPHPLREDLDLIHAAVEGPEAACYYRGKSTLAGDGRAEVKLPDYFTALCNEEDATIQLQCIGPSSYSLSCSEVEGGRFLVYGPPEVRFFWRVEATRKDIPPLVIEAPRFHETVVPSIAHMKETEADVD